MDISQLLEIFSNPETISTLSQVELLKAIIFTIIMGMGTTTIVLALLMFCTSAMYRFFGGSKTAISKTGASGTAEKSPQEEEELAVVITASVAAVLNTDSDNISIRSIKKL
jgi:sodium pump decarboxylase gamma subunit